MHLLSRINITNIMQRMNILLMGDGQSVAKWVMQIALQFMRIDQTLINCYILYWLSLHLLTVIPYRPPICTKDKGNVDANTLSQVFL